VTRTFRSLALVLVVAGALAGCSGKGNSPDPPSDRPTVEVTAQPQDAQSAQVIAEQVLDNLSDGDWAGAYDLWTDSAKSAIGRDAYIELVSTCATQAGEYQITGLTPVDDSTATIKWSHTPTSGGTAMAGTSTVRYQNGAWRFEPDAAALAAYRQNKCP